MALIVSYSFFQIQYEVFYPSPATSSISHNPKYIKQDVFVAPGENNEHVLHGKPKKQHRGKQRKRMTLKDVDDCDLPSFHSAHDHFLTAVDSDTEECRDRDDTKDQQKTSECLLSTLIEKAERLQTMVNLTKSRRRKNSSKSGKHYEEDKSHIVYAPELQSTKETAKSRDTGGTSSQSEQQPASFTSVETTRVLLPSGDVTMTSLQECFGSRYWEASCIPRKFVLDITSNVRDLLKKQGVQQRVADTTDDAISYLICIHDGFYDDQYEVYKVFLNSRLRQGLLAVEMKPDDSKDLFRGNVMSLISQTIDFVEGLVTKLREDNHFPAFYNQFKARNTDRKLKHHLASAEAYVPSVQRVFALGSAAAEVSMPSLSEMVQEEPAFCDICYDDVSPLTQGSAPATALLKCRHRVCDNCWSQHIHSRLQQGFVRVTCPGFDCQEEVKVGVMLSVAAVDTVEKLMKRQEEIRIGASPTEKWCPNELCGRVIQIRSTSAKAEVQLQQDVLCECGAHVCFHCLMPAHWPASCKQAEDYRTNLITTAFPDRIGEVHDDRQVELDAKRKRELEQTKTMLVEGKHCPKCHSFVFKFGGCPQMSCRCGQLFCWFCGKPGYSHPDRVGCVTVEQEKKLTTTVVVHHLEAYKTQEDKKKEVQQAAKANRRQRVSLVERAVEHHRHHQDTKQHGAVISVLARTVATAAAKDKNLSQNIIKACAGTSAASGTTSPSMLSASRASSVQDTVTSFLKDVVRSKKELHEVVEYSLVLLKDMPESLLKRRALRISEDLSAFCSFVQSVFDAWSVCSSQVQLQEAVKAVLKLVEIQGWIHSALASHVITVKKLRNTTSAEQ